MAQNTGASPSSSSTSDDRVGMEDRADVTASLRERMKRLIVEKLNLEGLAPETIGDDSPLFGDGLGLDSVDALELVVAIEKEFGIKVQSHEVGKEAFASVSALAGFVQERVAAKGEPDAPR